MSESGVPAAHGRVARDVLESLLEGCQVIGFDYTYLYVNDSVVRQGKRSREELLGKTMMECYPGIDRSPMFPRLQQCMQERRHDRMLNEFTFPDGSQGWFELRFIPVTEGTCILSLDVTESKRAEAALARTEEHLRSAQRMEAVGRLAGGVTHDFNNLLTVVLSYASLVLSELPQNHPLRADLAEIKRAGERGADLTRQLLAFSRQQVLQAKVLDLAQIVLGMEKMITRLLGAGIEVTILPSTSLGKVRADPGSLEQVIMNLVVNARDAMPNGGKLSIHTKNVSLDADYAKEHLEVSPGPYVMLSISDTGIGMDRDTQARIFEPFFTTKELGKGTGLGLSTVFGIVKQSGGHVWVYSEVGKGTTFKIYFPRDEGDEDAPVSRSITSDSVRGSETILVVEDDDRVRAVICGILRRNGYTVIDASSAGEALLVSEQFSAKVHLLLTDVVLPRMTGPQLAERLRSAREGLKVLFMSGYTDVAVFQHGTIDSDSPFLQKPITPDALTRKVREVLGR